MRFTYSYIEEKTKNILLENNLYTPGFDVNKLAKKLKIDVIDKEFDDDVSGLFVMSDNGPIISYNKKEDKKRQRFTIAHELGHYFLHANDRRIFIDKKPKVMYRNTASSSGELHQEREANAFAAALLMPAELIEDALTKCQTQNVDIIRKMAKLFNVSEQAMSFRLSNLGYDIGLY